MKPNEIENLIKKYFRAEGYTFPNHFEHRYDPDSSAILYSLIRKYKPKRCLQIGTWEGGSASIIVAALEKNGGKYTYVASELLDDKREATQWHIFEHLGVVPAMIGDITQARSIPDDLDFIFVDTNHDLDTTKWILKNIFPKLKKGALVFFHDWAVEEVDGELIGKGEGGQGGWPETTHLMELITNGKLPLEKIYWTWHNPAWETMSKEWESAYWIWRG